MNKIIITFLTLLIQNVSFGQTTEFNNKPWDNQKYPIIIDPYQGNEIDFEKLIEDKKVAGIIHKASQGLTADAKYKSRSINAKSKGLLYASYHLGTNEDPIKQADFYLKTIADNLNEPMALDIEEIGGNNISLKDAEKFIARIYERTNRYPFIYVNNTVFDEINKEMDANSIFSKCPLWYARFISKLPELNKKIWKNVTLWQFSCEINCCECDYDIVKKECKTLKNGRTKYSREYTPLASSGKKSIKTGYSCPYKIAGTSCDIDINSFNGDINTLKSFWYGKNEKKATKIDDFLFQIAGKSKTVKKHLLSSNNMCGVKEVYYVEIFSNGNISDRFIVYEKDNKFIKSVDFLNWAYEKVKYDDNFEDAINRVDVKYLGNDSFNFNYNMHNSHLDGLSLDLKFNDKGEDWYKYNFPQSEVCLTADAYIKTFTNFNTYKLIEINKGDTFRCGYQQVYFIEGMLKSGKLERTMLYKRNNKFIMSNEFIKFCTERINIPNSAEFDMSESLENQNRAYQHLNITYREEIGYFALRTVEDINPQDPNKAIVYFTKSDDFIGYDFPTEMECK